MTRLSQILFVTDAFFPETGGVERVCRELGAALVRLGHRVRVLARECDTAPRRQIVDGISVVRYPVPRRFAPYIYARHCHVTRDETRRILENEPPDLAHLHLPMSSQGALFALAGRDIPLVAGFYGPWHKEFRGESLSLRQSSGPPYRAYLKMQEGAQKLMQRRMLTRADRVVLLSDFSRGEALELAPSIEPKIRKIPGGVDPERFSPRGERKTRRRHGLGEKTPLLFTVRRLTRRMGVDILLSAMALLEDSFPETRLLIAGDGPERPALEAITRELGLSRRVRFLGPVGDEELADLYRSCDLFIMPSRSQENFGLPIIEAAACGTPTVATPAGSIPELMSLVESPFLSAGCDAASLARTIADAIPRLEAMKSRFTNEISRRIRADYAWEKIARDYLELYQEVLRERRDGFEPCASP